MNTLQELKKFGLRRSEATIYLYLLENGLSSPSQIAKGTGISRTNCYHILRSLQEKLIIQIDKKGARTKYAAKDPRTLLITLKKNEEVLENMMPDLEALYAKQTNKPKVRFYEGLEEVEQIYLETLSAEKIRGIGSMKQLSGIDPGFYQGYVRELKKRHIIFDDILTQASNIQGSKASEIIQALYQVRFLPSRHGDFPTDILIWDEKIALISLTEPIFGTVLSNPALGSAFKIIFEIVWESLENSR